MKEYFGWVQGSDMAAIYVHLSGRDVDSAILKLHGIQDEQDDGKREGLSPRDCSRCQLRNPGSNKFCSRCGLPLDEEAAVQMLKADFERKRADQTFDKLVEDEEFKEMLLRKVRELS